MRRAVFWLTFLGVAYALAVFFSYRHTPLGQVALLDAREQQILAQKMAYGQLGDEPYYRAPLYAGVLSIFYRFGMNDDQVLLAGQLLNIAFHLLAAVFLGLAARRFWKNDIAGLLSGGIYAFYPVALYLAVDLFDATLGQFLLCVGLFFVTRYFDAQKFYDALAIGFLFALAFFDRPQLGAIGFAVLAYMLWTAPKQNPKAVWMAVGVFGLCIVAWAGMEKQRTGTWYVLPTQGAYNLWSANRPGATGEYYAQQVELDHLKDGENPAQAEAKLLYRQETGVQGSITTAQINHYWREKFQKYVAKHPFLFAKIYTKKLYALLNNHEAYNNKTYALQKRENTFLRLNPIGFVFIGTMAVFALLLSPKLPKLFWPSLGFAVAYWLSEALFYTSDRFRLPLVPFFLIFAGGLLLALANIRSRGVINLPGKCLFVFCWAVVFTVPLFGVGASPTTVADQLLMAQAALRTGNDQKAAEISQSLAAQSQPTQASVEALLQARYNLLLEHSQAPSDSWCQETLLLGKKLKSPSPQASYILALASWQLYGQRDIWHDLALGDDSAVRVDALAARLVTGRVTAEEVALFAKWHDDESPQNLPLILAQMHLGPFSAREKAKAKLVKMLGEKQAQTTSGAWWKLFDRPAQNPLNK